MTSGILFAAFMVSLGSRAPGRVNGRLGMGSVGVLFWRGQPNVRVADHAPTTTPRRRAVWSVSFRLRRSSRNPRSGRCPQRTGPPRVLLSDQTSTVTPNLPAQAP